MDTTSQRDDWHVTRHRIRTFIGFASIALANAVLARITHAANYLIIPYPQPVVILLELLPAVLTKLFLPFIYGYIPQNARIALVTGAWTVVKTVVSATPPNVLPPVRVVMTLLAASSSAATEILCLDLIRGYGRLGLIAWAAGTSLGQMANAIWPLVLTSFMGMTVREGTEYMYRLVAIILLAYFAILPRNCLPTGSETDLSNRDTGGYNKNTSLLETTSTSNKVTGIFGHQIRQVSVVSRQYLHILLATSAMQAMVFPGISLALDGSSFSSLLSWTSALAFSLSFGNLTARLSAMSLRLGNHRIALILLAWTVALLLADSIFFLGSSFVVLSVALCSGLLGGAIYVEVFDGVLQALSDHPDCILAIGIIGAGDTLGSLLGGWIGFLWEATVCDMTVDRGRFCHRFL
ncbi:uncharacterized protein LY79DRAFT_584976 [Colletotrichum navitas]|uniref:Protein BTN n=1 Tax=Colletotrichum navitas TaxID=681940 RepID=A0AAD8PKU6_9PEZI|nr:uncharacterized protein LY79DRAFT_584976 [Colletotrichum navitas]KAK1566156.1 hypothetical protein LY79DRAFT_584976 [Colletotrichum navitas]